MKLRPEPFSKIMSGEKTIESRLFDEKRRLINPGDVIRFVHIENPNEFVSAKVRALYRYASFDEMFSEFSPAEFGGESKEFLLNQIHAYYPLEEESKYGVLGIRVQKI